MDDIVIKAMAKWPNVPNCFGWLMLDARGAWRMRNEATQAANAPGDRIVHEALLGFINRNYLQDEHGRWYFQNGPQRVFVNLEAAPFVAQTQADGRLRLHTGEMLDAIDCAWFTPAGGLYLQCGERVALVDDRDLVECLPRLRLDGELVSDARLMEWIDEPASGQLTFDHAGQVVPVALLASDDPAQHFGFVRLPQP
jgi:hypothetical protein